MLTRALGTLVSTSALLLFPLQMVTTDVENAGALEVRRESSLIVPSGDLPCAECVTWYGGGTHTFWGTSGSGTCVYGQPNCHACLDENCVPETLAEGTCENHHAPCGMTDDDAEMLARALEADDRDVVETLMEEYPQTLRRNSERGVVQVLDCNGYVKAQLRM